MESTGEEELAKGHPTASNETRAEERPGHKVIIIGAGIAGLAAAYELCRSGLSEVTVLEAQNRVGGRIHTLPLGEGEGVIELGAQWVHGEEGNPLYAFARERDLISDPRVDYSVEGEGRFCVASGGTLDLDLVQDTICSLDRIKDEVSSGLLLEGQENNVQSVGQIFREKFQKHVKCEKTADSAILWGIFNWYMRFENIDNACTDLRELSVKAYSDWVDCPGVPLINLREGYQSVIDALLEKIPQNIIHVNSPVQRVCYFKDKAMIELHLENSTAVVEANHVVVTCSIGYLKKNMSSLFEPALSPQKSKVIRHLGFGTINKIYLQFEEPFWATCDLGFQLIWMDTDARDLPSWIYHVSGFDVVRGQPNMLVGWIGGRGAQEVEEVSESTIGLICTKVLRMFLRKDDIDEPIKVIRTKWGSNKYIGGSYSHRSLQYQKMGLSIEDLVEPVTSRVTIDGPVDWPCLLFAGEATDTSFFSSTHGALASGLREAERLLLFARNLAPEKNCTD